MRLKVSCVFLDSLEQTFGTRLNQMRFFGFGQIVTSAILVQILERCQKPGKRPRIPE